MSASPFSSFKEFSEASGDISSFSHIPWVSPTLLVIATLMFIWFVVKSYLIKH
jgi:hypothetical protein